MPNILNIFSPEKISPKKFRPSRPVLKSILVLATASLMTIPQISSATNGMNMEGYGPIATGMGGASMAYDNGTAAVMNNPATLGLMEDGEGKLDVAVGTLSPNISSSTSVPAGTPKADSSADLFIMPALGWVTKKGSLSYGFGVFSQGGMGTEYKANSYLAAGSGEKVRSEVGVGRLSIPLAYTVNSDLSIGGTVDYVWAGMDLKMAMPGSDFFDFAFGSQAYGTAGGSLVQGLGGAIAATQIAGVNWVRFDFSDSGDFTGEAKGSGVGGKIGAVYKVSETVKLGATYHSKTSISDLNTSNAGISMNVVEGAGGGGMICGGAGMACTIDFQGKMKVKDFQWPDIFALGAAFQATRDLMLVADYKRINWPSAMKDFNMIFSADANQANPVAQNFVNQGGTSVDVLLYQDWEVQNVLQLGGAYQTTNDLVLRAGVNLANNPVPDKFINSLFPAIIKNHVSIGAGYTFTPAHELNLAYVYAPGVKVNATDPTTGAKTGTEITHSQSNWQFMYSYTY